MRLNRDVERQPLAGNAPLGAVSLIQRSQQFSRPVYLSVVAGLAAVTFGLGFAALALTPPGGTSAIWWPAAGTSALLALLYRGPRWQVLLLVAAVATSSNLLIDRPPVFAAWATIILVAELLVFLAVLGPPKPTALLSTTRGLARFIVASVAASVTVGIIGAFSFVILVDANPLVTFTALVPSHLSALLIIVPIALVPVPRGLSRQRGELIVQTTLTAIVTLLIFSPAQNDAIGALLFPLFGWAAMRFVPIVASAELIVLGVASSALTVLGGGPYAAVGQGLPAALLVQVYLLSMAITIHFITTVRSEQTALRAENDRQSAILRGGFVGSQVGSAFIRTDMSGRPVVLEANDVAQRLISADWFDRFVAAWTASRNVDVSTEVLLDDGRTLQVYGRQVSSAGNETVLGVQLVDISDFVAAQKGMSAVVERERQVAEELRALAQQKDNFVSAVSHELRTPITSIVGFAEELDETASVEQQVRTQIILRNAHRLTEMVEELLELGRMTAPNPIRDHYVVGLATVVRDTVADHAATARDRGVTVEIAVPEKRVPVAGNATALTRVVSNLLVNALKFTPSGGTVVVTVTDDGTQICLSVDDSGPGISDDDAPHVFERFYRSNDAEKRQTPGTGLGLSIVKSLVELLGGNIEVRRSDLGGARFVLLLPSAPHTSASPGRPS